ncbi:Uncharacterized conserved protein, DUF2147 family [Acidocella aminolytica 101 = DSM 11237]|uniref:DUF2147 domain-containing protein n=1 Tax=Acidocella aminolytica TaxID=33998 RepID=UPI000920E624|nr:DUF2147 domain-containing protein [Acidocella aminolytica]SHF20613.1 Uncharacterized conserved protein, DUF2147 family [Acidocella aminolytica 101 = DSM 11237]
MTLVLHIISVAAPSVFVRRVVTSSLNKRHCLGDYILYRVRLLAGILLASAVSVNLASAAPFKSGYWESTGHQIVLQIVSCGADLCGFITGIALDHPDDPMPRDWRGQSQCGFLMLRVAPDGTTRQGAPRWKGVLQDPRNGDVYRTMVSFDKAGQLDLHGYIGLPILGETQIWPKFTGQIHPGCHVPALDTP